MDHMTSLRFVAFTWDGLDKSSSYFTFLGHLLTNMLTIKSLSVTLIRYRSRLGQGYRWIQPRCEEDFDLDEPYYASDPHRRYNFTWKRFAGYIKTCRDASLVEPYGSQICNLQSLELRVRCLDDPDSLLVEEDFMFETMPLMRMLEPGLRELEHLKLRLEMKRWPRTFETPIWSLKNLKTIDLEVLPWWEEMEISPIVFPSSAYRKKEMLALA